MDGLLRAGRREGGKAAGQFLAAVAALFLGATPSPAQAPADSFTVSIAVPSQGDTLVGYLRVAAGAGPHLTVVHLQGFPGSVREALPGHLQAAGINGVGFNFRGSRRSGGVFTVEGTVDDARAMVTFLRSDSARRLWRVDPDRIAVVGASSGSLSILSTLADDPRIVCAADVVPFNWMRGTMSARTDSTIRAGFYDLLRRLTGASPPIIKEKSPGAFVDHTLANAERYDLVPVGSRLRNRKVLLVGAQHDSVAPLPTHFFPLRDAIRAAGGVLRDTIVTDSHNLRATSDLVTEAIIRFLRGC